jgi:hypothetical protein
MKMFVPNAKMRNVIVVGLDECKYAQKYGESLSLGPHEIEYRLGNLTVGQLAISKAHATLSPLETSPQNPHSNHDFDLR